MKNILSYLWVYTADSAVRLNVGMLLGMILNSFYIVLNLIWGIKYENVWFVTVAAYYMLVAMFRYFLLGGAEQGSEREALELLGILMLILTAPMTGMIIYTVITGASRGYPSASLPIFAVYAVFSVIRAIVGLASKSKERRATLRTIYFIRLSIASMSLFNLQTSLFGFLKINTPLTVTLNFITGGAVTFSMLNVSRQTKIHGK